MLEVINESTVREKLDSILSAREFSQGESGKSITEYLAGWVKSIFEWIKQKLQSIKLPDANINLMPDSGLSSGAALGLKILSGVLIASLIFVLLFFIFRKLRLSKNVREKEDILLINTLKDPELVLRTALDFCSRGDFLQGFRYLYISMILEFNARNIIKIHKSKTNREYLAEIRDSGYAGYDDMVRFTRAFNDHWYGSRPITADEFDYWYSKYKELLAGENI